MGRTKECLCAWCITDTDDCTRNDLEKEQHREDKCWQMMSDDQGKYYYVNFLYFDSLSEEIQ